MAAARGFKARRYAEQAEGRPVGRDRGWDAFAIRVTVAVEGSPTSMQSPILEIRQPVAALRARLARLAASWTAGAASEPWVAEFRAIRLELDRLLLEVYRARGAGELDAPTVARVLPALEQARDLLRTIRPRFDPERLRARVHGALARLGTDD